ncbi:unnamed protein product, partial [Mesorhabditis spiculigera]
MTFFQKLKFFYHILISHNSKITQEDVEKCKQKDLLEQLLAELDENSRNYIAEVATSNEAFDLTSDLAQIRLLSFKLPKDLPDIRRAPNQFPWIGSVVEDGEPDYWRQDRKHIQYGSYISAFKQMVFTFLYTRCQALAPTKAYLFLSDIEPPYLESLRRQILGVPYSMNQQPQISPYFDPCLFYVNANELHGFLTAKFEGQAVEWLRRLHCPKFIIAEAEPRYKRCLADSQVYILGTKHDSPGSCQDVNIALRSLRPDVVVLELCQDRFEVVKTSVAKNGSRKRRWKLFGDAPGEFAAAVRSANELGNVTTVLGDRAAQTTIGRIYSVATFREALRKCCLELRKAKEMSIACILN